MIEGAGTVGYRQVSTGRCAVVVREDHADDAVALLQSGTLHEAASRDPSARALAGRGISYAIALPVSGVRAVVRHNRHGGLLARLTGDLFLPPTRAPYELFVSRQLQAAGVRTPDVLMIGVMPALGLLRRSDVVTREITGGRDLAAYMQPGESASARSAAWAAARALVAALNAAGARHHDLNVKNILLCPASDGLDAWVLDVDRVTLGTPGAAHVRRGNAARLRRSARKWRDQRGAELDESELAALD